MSTHALKHRLVLTTMAVMLAFTVAACSQPSSAPDAAARPAATDASGQEPADGSGSEGSAELGGAFAPVEQRIVKTGEVGLEVDNVAVVLAQVRATAVELGGYVGASQAGTLEQTASVTLRVPAERFDELISRLREMSDVEVVSMSTREQDVTGQIVDLEARIRNLEASEASYRVLFDRAEKIEDVLTVQGRLDEVRGVIEQLEAQLEAVEGQAALSTLTVTIIPRDEPVEAVQAEWDPGAQVNEAVATLVGLGQGLFAALIWLGIVILPIVLVIGLIALGAIRLVPELRRRITPAEAEASGDRPAG